MNRAVAGLLGAQAVFQVGLAIGAPWGAAAYGGQHAGRLPARLRSVSGIAAVVYAGVAVDLLCGPETARRRTLLTAVSAFTGLGVVTNALSRSPRERLWAPWCAATSYAAWRAR